jgi:molecular chaperone GrpE (heat shock protein)
MSDSTEPRLPKWPFYLGDGLLLGAAYFICSRTPVPLGFWQVGLAVLCVAVGAILCVAPYLSEYRAGVKLAEARGLVTVVAQIQNLERIAGQISGATGKWQEAQEQADKTAAAARDISERMTAEVKSFTEFMQRANDSEKATLRLEVDKLRRGEGDWLQVLVRLLDHVYALHLAALRSNLPSVIEQVGQFQAACRDAARRVGLTPFTAGDAEPFDAQRHQSIEDGAPPPPDAVVAETMATGYTFQGKLIRPALVRLGQNLAAPPLAEDATPAAAAAAAGESQLPLEPEPKA